MKKIPFLFKGTKKQKDDVKNNIIPLTRDTFNVDVEKFKLGKIKESGEAGLKQARKTPPEPKPDCKIPPEFEVKLRKDFLSKNDELYSWVDPKLSELDNNYTEQIHQYNAYKKNKEVKEQEIKENIAEKKDIDIKRLETSSERQHIEIDEKISDATLEVEHSKGTLSELSDTLEIRNEVSPSKIPSYYYLLVLLLMILEFPFNEVAFSAMREALLHTIVMSLGISVVIPIMGHFAGKYAKARKEDVKDYVIMFLPIVTAIALSFIVGYVRSNYLSHKDVYILPIYALSFLNLVFFIMGLLLSYYYSYINPVLVKHYFKTQKEHEANKKELDHVKGEKESLDNQLAEEKKRINDKYEEEFQNKTDNHYFKQRKDILKTANEYNHLLSSATSLEKLIDSYFFQSVHEYRHANTQRRADSKVPVCFAIEPEHLGLKYTNLHKKEPFLNEDDGNNNLSGSRTRNSIPTGNLLQQLATMLLIVLCSSLFLVGCQTSGYNSSLVYVAVDKTDSYEINNPLSSKDIIAVAGLDKEVNNSCTVFTTDINDVSLNAVKQVSIAQGSIWEDNQLDRRDLFDAFYVDLDSLLYQVFAFEGEKKKSSIYLPLCDILTSIVVDSADTKILFLYSDMFENNSSQTTSFYKYIKNPSELLSSFDKVVESLEKVETLPNLNGIEINIIYTPSVANDDLFVYARKFWEQLLSQKGAKVEFLANY